jgi:GMP synthase (glutamine-hydrolysing)
METRSADIHAEKILIVDFGAQYTQLIARRVREAGVYCEIHPFDADSAALTRFAPRGVILSGGPESVTEGATPRIPSIIFELGVPILGICYGMQALAQQLGGTVESSTKREFGAANVRVVARTKLLSHLPEERNGELAVWMSHGDKVTKLPPGFTLIGSSASAPIAAMADEKRRIYGVQFHPEVTHTPAGREILRRFAIDICACQGLWTPQHIVETSIEAIRNEVKGERVVLGLSGGVDSSVVAALLARAIGRQLTCVFVDHGLLRLDERQEVERTFAPSNTFDLDLRVVDASEEFLTRLAGVTDPEAKRKIIGRTFIEVFDREAGSIEGVKYLAQGTIYPDVIESAASKFGKAHVIKSHHNVGGLPDTMNLKLLEPLRELFKDEVRAVGLALGLPHDLVYRHPFPGPGLGVRILGEVTKEAADMLRAADAIYISELKQAGWYEKVGQAFAVLLPVKSVGVVGDARRYAPVIALRAVESTDFMTARAAELPYELVAHVANRIVNEIAGVSRVVYDVTSKPPATIEWE